MYSYMKIDEGNTIVFEKENPIAVTVAKDYKLLRRENNGSDKAPKLSWKREPGGRCGFAGSGTSIYTVTLNEVPYRVTVNRYANGKSFYGTNHQLEIAVTVAA